MMFYAYAICFIFSFFHAIYVSVTEIKFDENANKLEIKVKVFTNDLEDGILNLSGKSISLRTDDQLNSNQQLINQYINDRLGIKVNETNKPLVLLKSENEGDATWSYFEMTDVGDVRSLEVRNKILTELFETQSNVVSVDVGGEKKFLRFTKSFEKEVIIF